MRSFSGQTRIRLPTGLHAALAAEAKRQDVSMNTLMVTLLAGALHWKPPGPPPTTRPRARSPR